MSAITKAILSIGLFVCLLDSTTLSAEPIMQNLVDQENCNTSGRYYDHSRRKCTSVSVLPCTTSSLRKLIDARAKNATQWHAVHEKITKKGYEVSQCLKPRDHELVVSYVRRGLWPEFKTVRVLTH